MKIKVLKFNSFVGLREFNLNPDKNLNVFVGPKGTGKSSILEGIEKAFSNIGRRTELINNKTDADEATLYIETDSGLEIDRRLRSGGKTNYLKLRQQGEGVNSTEAELRKLIRGDIFRPLDFVNLQAKEQTEIILGMIKMSYTAEQICDWFGEDVLSGINIDKHMLQVLKDIENKFYKEREEVNRDIRSLKEQIKTIERDLPDNYNGNEWKEKKLQDYYSKVSEALKINGLIKEAKSLKDNFDNKVNSLKADGQNKKENIALKYKQLEEDSKDIIDLSKGKIDKANFELNTLDNKLNNELEILELDTKNKIQEAIEKIKADAELVKESIKKEHEAIRQNNKDLIQMNEQKISVKESEILGIEEKKQLEFETVDQEVTLLIEKEKERIGNASKYLEENTEIEIEPLQQEAENVATMQSYLRDWDRANDIRDGKLATKETYSEHLTSLIEIARNKPSELLKQHELPLDGISVDENGLIRINGILLDGLSVGERLETAFKIALQRMGELRIMCLDGFGELNKSEQKKIVEMCEANDIQAFVTLTEDVDSDGFEIRNEI